MQPLKFVNHKIDEYSIQVTYDPVERTGKVVHNLSLVQAGDLEQIIPVFRDAYASGISMSSLIGFLGEGEILGDYRIPGGCTGVITVCSSTLDGILMRKGIPLRPIGGGAVEVERRVPKRFIHMILFEHTTIDPLQVLASQDITSINAVMRTGSGVILANLRECHMEAESLLGTVFDDLSGSSFSGILDVGMPNTPALGVTVDPQYLGVVAVGGTNPVAAVKEKGFWVQTQAMKGLIEATELHEIREF
jgi:repressor of nif and glnA expression